MRSGGEVGSPWMTRCCGSVRWPREMEIPGLPVDLGSLDVAGIGEAATTAADGLTGAATGAVEDLTAAAGDAVTTAGTQLTDTVSGISDAAR